MAEYQECDFSVRSDWPPGASFDAMEHEFHAPMNRSQSPCDICDHYASSKCSACGYFGTIVSSITG